MALTKFIHYLHNPAAIATLDFVFLDVNDEMINDIKAPSKDLALTFLTENFLVNNECKVLHLEELNKEGKICNQKMMVRKFGNNYDLRNVNYTLITGEQKLIFIETFGAFKNQMFFIEKISSLLKEIKKLDVSLNKNGKPILDEIIKGESENLKQFIDEKQIANAKGSISNHYPFLTENEIEFCVLIISGFSTQDIAIFQETTINNTRVVIHRICKKFNVENRMDLKNYIMRGSEIRFF